MHGEWLVRPGGSRLRLEQRLSALPSSRVLGAPKLSLADLVPCAVDEVEVSVGR
jgi:hypothetical protein